MLERGPSAAVLEARTQLADAPYAMSDPHGLDIVRRRFDNGHDHPATDGRDPGLSPNV
jgi:hypothetical protein